MRLPFTHPNLGELSAFAADELSTSSHQAMAHHLRGCARCQESLRFVHRISEPALKSLSAPSDELLARIQHSRANGERVILPALARDTQRTTRSRLLGVAASVLCVVALWRALAPSEAMASIDEGVLTLAPALPKPGGRVQVHYVPPANHFVGAQALRVRARLRLPMDGSYAFSVPASQTRAVGTLTRKRDGAFEGSFTVPDSVVFAVLAVESLDSSYVDDNSERGWEMLVATPTGAPMFSALMQRGHDMMGRSWEQGYASAVRATELYPDSIAGWTFREFFERQLFTGALGDSIRALRQATVDALVARAKLAPDRRDKSLNYFGVDASQPLAEWRRKGWIHADDPRGWFQWYCRYYMGRRMPDEDHRQIKRWKAIRRHVRQVERNCEPGELTCRKRQRQALLHWAYDSRKI